MHRHIGRYRRSKQKKSLTIDGTRYLLFISGCVYIECDELTHRLFQRNYDLLLRSIEFEIGLGVLLGA